MVKVTKYLKYLITGPRFYMGGGGSAPQAPDPYQTALSQLDINKRQANFDAQMNRYTQNGPTGSIGWVNKGDANNPNWVQTTSLSPEQQQLYSTQMGTQNQSAQMANQNLGNLQDAIGGGAQKADYQTFQDVQKSLLDQMQPGLDHSTDMLKTQLANQGLNPNSEAYQNAMREDSTRRNNANLQSISNATAQEAQQQQMANAFQNQSIANQAALTNGGGNVTMPTYGGGTQISGGSPADMTTLANNQYQGQLAAYNANQAGKNSGLSGGLGMLGTIGGGLLGGPFGASLGGMLGGTAGKAIK